MNQIIEIDSNQQIQHALNEILALYEIEGRISAKFIHTAEVNPFVRDGSNIYTVQLQLRTDLRHQRKDFIDLSLIADIFKKFQDHNYRSILNIILSRNNAEGGTCIKEDYINENDTLTITFNKNPEIITFILHSVIGLIKSEIENESHFLVPLTKTGLLLGLVIPRVAADPIFCPAPAVAELNCTLKTALAHFLKTVPQLDPEVLNILQGAEFDLHQTILKESLNDDEDGGGDEFCFKGFIKINMFFPSADQEYETVQGIQTIQKMNSVIDAFWEHIAQDCLEKEINHFTNGVVNDALVPGTVLEMLNKLKETCHFKWEPIRPGPKGWRFMLAANDDAYGLV